MKTKLHHPFALFVVVMSLHFDPSTAAEPPTFKTELFNRDPGWEGFNNRLKPDPQDIRTVIQSFGYTRTHLAGGKAGEMGGTITRTAVPAFYADKIPIKSLEDKMTASGKFSVDPMEGNSGVWFGWFNAAQEAGCARPKGALGLDFDFERGGARLAVRMSNQQNKFCGTFITPYLPGIFRPAPLHPHTPYVWTLTYDPQANAGNGRIEFTVKSEITNPTNQARNAQLGSLVQQLPEEQRARFGGDVGHPEFEGRAFVVDLPPGFKKDGATFDRFGLINLMKEGGGPSKVWFDDLKYDGKAEDFAQEPKWEGAGNRGQFRDVVSTGVHDFGFCAGTRLAGGARAGEVGGTFWRLTKAYGYYADKIGPLTLNDPLEARGKLMLKTGTPDSEMGFGWFSSAQKEVPVHLKDGRRQEGHLDKTDNFVGIYLAGPTRLGRVLLPAVISGRGRKVIFKEPDRAPRPAPNQSYDWTIKYDPAADAGRGALTVTLGEATATLPLESVFKQEGAAFDRFGFFTSGGGGKVEIYFDDLQYTAARPNR
jgi:hypothetical protein